MASSDATPFPLKGVAYRVYFPVLNADGMVENITGMDSEISKDGGTFANCTNEATEIVTIVHDVNDTTNTITSDDATDQTTANTLLNEIKTDYNLHRVSTVFHDEADTTNVVDSADATDAATSWALANEIKTDYNAHRSQVNVHYHDDIGNEVISDDAVDLASVMALANEIKTDYNAHLSATAGSGMCYLDLTSVEVSADAIILLVKSTNTDALTTPITLYPVEPEDIPVNIKTIDDNSASVGNLQLDYTSGYDKSASTIGTCTTNSDMVGTDSVPTNPLLTNDVRLDNLDANISTRSTVTTVQVNEQVVDVMKTDVTAEMVQGAPPATPTFEEMISYIYFRLRNKCETTATEDAIYNNAGDTKLFKAVISDNGTTFTKTEYVSGA